MNGLYIAMNGRRIFIFSDYGFVRETVNIRR